jgi:hypothetical protein
MFLDVGGVSGRVTAAVFAQLLHDSYCRLLDHRVPEKLAELAGRIRGGPET